MILWGEFKEKETEKSKKEKVDNEERVEPIDKTRNRYLENGKKAEDGDLDPKFRGANKKAREIETKVEETLRDNEDRKVDTKVLMDIEDSKKVIKEVVKYEDSIQNFRV